ncbi:bifunctional metallophosphatase/5'-nucleotidase [Cohnella suwonensis]|uniref:Bifunctional metallophosphatase/5'-nucleotidase n=1 Tax=Cohnella suwonensis TaxID=696072 RepID=A0ABW0LUL7_9BACL
MTKAGFTISLIHTNDLHSHLEQHSRIARYISDARREVGPEGLVVVDCGDFLDRARMETEGSKAAVNVETLEAIGYDAAALGNNEGLSYTTGELDALFGGSRVPIVCANMKLKKTGERPAWMKPSVRLERMGVRIGIIGLTAPFTSYYELLGWEVAEPMEALMEETARLRPEVDMLILLSHLGIRADELIAETVPGIDLILGGHTHHLLEKPLRVGNAAICAAGKFGDYVGTLELRFDGESRLTAIDGGSVPTSDWPSDERFDRLVERHREQARNAMNRPIATLKEPLSLRYDRESALPTLLAAAVRRATGAEIGLVNAGQLLRGLPEGEVTELTVHAICPSPINPCSIELKGRQILNSLEESLLPELQQLEIRGFGFRGRVLGTLCMDGLEATANLSSPPFGKVAKATVNGEPIDPERSYTVGTLDMFTFGAGYVGLKEGRNVRYFLPAFIRDLLSESLNDERLAEEANCPRWTYH